VFNGERQCYLVIRTADRIERIHSEFMWPESFDLLSPLARDECVRRLRAKTESWWFPPIFSNKPVVGYVEDTSFLIRKRITHSNPFQPHLEGDLVDEDGRTRVRCDFGMRLTVVAFMAIWFGFLLFMAGTTAIGAIVALLGGHSPANNVWENIAGPALMMALGAAFVRLCRFSARNERQFLVDVLRDTIDAREGGSA